MEYSYYSNMRVSTKKRDESTRLSYFHWLRIIIMVLCCAWLLGWGLTHNTGVSGQVIDLYEFEASHTTLACEYLINGEWVRQFTGKVHEINASAVKVEWFRYSESTGVKNYTFHNPGANKYQLKINVKYDINTSRTYGIFKIYWFSGSELIDTDHDDGYLVCRDSTGSRVYIADIDKVRIGSYDIGEFT